MIYTVPTREKKALPLHEPAEVFRRLAAGAKLGGATGAAIGSVLPGIGTEAVNVFGGAIGGIGGSILGSQLPTVFQDFFSFLLPDNNIIKHIKYDDYSGTAQNVSAATNMNISQMQYNRVSCFID